MAAIPRPDAWLPFTFARGDFCSDGIKRLMWARRSGSISAKRPLVAAMCRRFARCRDRLLIVSHIRARSDMTNTICPDAFLSPFVIKETVKRALAEDFGRAGDVTSVATVPAGLAGHAMVAARE